MESSSSSQKCCTEEKDHSKGEEPVNNENAEKAKYLKEKGNALFLSGNCKKAVQTYTEAIELDGICSMDQAMLYSNRCIALLKDEKYEAALEDAAKAVELWPQWWKGHFRMGQVYNSIHLYKKAETCFNQAAEREPNRQEVEQALSLVKRKREESDGENISAEDRRREFESRRAEAKKFMKDKYGFEGGDELPEAEKRAKHSEYFRQVLIAEHHFSEAIYILCKLINEDGFPLPLCEKFIEEFSSGAKIQIADAIIKMPKALIDYACLIVDHMLSLKAAAASHEDICVCYVELNVTTWTPEEEFLIECIHRYPFNAYFFAKRSRLMHHLQCYGQSLTDINTAIKLNPSNTQYLYFRADAMLLVSPEGNHEQAIGAFKEFLMCSPVDDPHVSAAYYRLCEIYERKSFLSRTLGDQTGAERCSVAAAHYRELLNAALFN